jgi:hypothetical protein
MGMPRRNDRTIEQDTQESTRMSMTIFLYFFSCANITIIKEYIYFVFYWAEYMI